MVGRQWWRARQGRHLDSQLQGDDLLSFIHLKNGVSSTAYTSDVPHVLMKIMWRQAFYTLLITLIPFILLSVLLLLLLPPPPPSAGANFALWTKNKTPCNSRVPYICGNCPRNWSHLLLFLSSTAEATGGLF